MTSKYDEPILEALKHGPASVTDLARDLGTPPGRLVYAVNGLLKAGRIKRGEPIRRRTAVPFVIRPGKRQKVFYELAQ